MTSLTKSTILTADTVLWCTKNCLPSWWFSFPSPYKKISPGLTVSPLSHPTSCTSTKSNLYLANSLAAVVFEILRNEYLRYLCEARWGYMKVFEDVALTGEMTNAYRKLVVNSWSIWRIEFLWKWMMRVDGVLTSGFYLWGIFRFSRIEKFMCT